MKKYIIWATLITALIVFPIGWFVGSLIDLPFFFENEIFISPLINYTHQKELPLLKYSINNLQNYSFNSSQITINQIIEETPNYTSYIFSFQTLGKTMTGYLNIPTSDEPVKGLPVIIMIRGWVPKETYTTGAGTKAAAAVFAKNGYVTLAPDFFGYGGSDLETSDSWEARFQKPISVVELIRTIRENPQISNGSNIAKLSSCGCDTHLWAHSNGGQVALTALEISGESLKTSLWAPVTAPFPYSVLFYSDEHDDEGKEMRKWVSIFEEDYDVPDFSLTQHLDKLSGSIQIHQGTADDAVPVAWNDEFVEKIKAENEMREEALAEIKNSTQSTKPHNILPPIDIIYFKYPGADHNMKPVWNTVIQRVLRFFDEILQK